MRTAELCAGYGGLHLALQQAGLDPHLEWYAETEPEPSTVMAHHHPDTPNLGDLTTITNPPPADIVTAGWPCQAVSVAGRRKGIDDERWIIRDVVALWRSTGARWLVLENVPGLLTANDGEAFGQVLDALSEVGATARWAHLRASDIGAPHRRERWFCVAHTDSVRRERPRSTRRRRPRPTGHDRPAPTNADGERRPLVRFGGLRTDSHPQPRGDADRRLRERFGGYAPAVHRWANTLGRPAPNPTTNNRLSPRFVEWMMGLPDGHVTTTPDLTRNAQLRVLGNGVVPQQAAYAITQLMTALTKETM